MNIWIVLPTYNESATLASLVTALLDRVDWRQLSANFPRPAQEGGQASEEVSGSVQWPESQTEDREEPPSVTILIVDDNSPDGTGAIADELAQTRAGAVCALHRPRKMGLGTAYVTGFSLALDRGADVIIEMDADFSHSPSYLPTMVSMLDEYDVVVGSRWAPGGRLDERWELWRYLLSKYANIYARWVTELAVADTTAGFKAFRADALRRLPLHQIRSDGYAFQIEMATACQRQGLRVAELPIYFEERVHGQSKMSWRIVVEAAWRVWQLRWSTHPPHFQAGRKAPPAPRAIAPK